MRRDVLDDTFNRWGILANPFQGLTIKQYDLELVKDIRNKAMLYYILHEPSALGNLSDTSRYRYKKLLASLGGGMELEMGKYFDQYKESLCDKIKEIMHFASRHDVVLYD